MDGHVNVGSGAGRPWKSDLKHIYRWAQNPRAQWWKFLEGSNTHTIPHPNRQLWHCSYQRVPSFLLFEGLAGPGGPWRAEGTELSRIELLVRCGRCGAEEPLFAQAPECQFHRWPSSGRCAFGSERAIASLVQSYSWHWARGIVGAVGVERFSWSWPGPQPALDHEPLAVPLI